MGALIRCARNRRQAAARISTGTRYAASPIVWNKAAATFAPIAPIQFCAELSPAAFHDGSFGSYETRQRPRSRAAAASAITMISFSRERSRAGSTSNSVGIAAILFLSEKLQFVGNLLQVVNLNDKLKFVGH